MRQVVLVFLRWLITFMICVLCIDAFANGINQACETDDPGKTGKPVSMSIHINKIYNVNALNETYSIDGYMLATWRDKELFKTLIKNYELDDRNKSNSLSIENLKLDNLIAKGLWVPVIEFINVIGERNVPNKRIVVLKSGEVNYNERFDATFTSDMDFRHFPFDKQTFSIQIESFSQNQQEMFFCNPKISLKDDKDFSMVEWSVVDSVASVSEKHYDYLKQTFSLYTADIVSKRASTYYLWNFILPLFLIIIASWSIFWIDDYQAQLGTAFTLMLTVVAFGFYTSNILPHLPYTSFLDSLVIVGYISIFVSTLIIIMSHTLSRECTESVYFSLIRVCRWSIPSIVIISVVFLKISFLGTALN